MKKEIQPKLHMACVVKCACGNTFTTISTLANINVEICSACHPFFTGQRRFVDSERRIDKFTKKFKLAEEKKVLNDAAKQAKAGKKTQTKETSNKSVKEMLDDIKKAETTSN